MRRQQAIQRKVEEEKAKAMEEERKMKEEAERRRREKEDQTNKQPFKPTTTKRVSCTKAMVSPSDLQYRKTTQRKEKLIQVQWIRKSNLKNLRLASYWANRI